MAKIQISQEYIDTVISWLEEWVADPQAMVIPQFLAKHGISWKYLKGMREIAPSLDNAFEVTIAKLHAKWLDLAFKKDELSRHLTSILMRYLRVYDDHAYEVEANARREIAEANAGASLAIYESEDFKQLKLSGRFEEIYRSNVDRRRSSGQTE